MEIAAILTIASIPVIVTGVEFARCVNPRFREWLKNEGWET